MEPAAGAIDGGVHRFPLRIYFEDTDLSGLVYHANYLRYLERGRSDLLACLGIDQRAALEAGKGAWAVADLAIAYRAPARLGDALVVETRLSALAGASVSMGQRIRRGERLLADATVRAAFLSPDGRPQRIPPAWRDRFAAFG
jgi:acyl-CoA thioester hydrolase